MAGLPYNAYAPYSPSILVLELLKQGGDYRVLRSQLCLTRIGEPVDKLRLMDRFFPLDRFHSESIWTDRFVQHMIFIISSIAPCLPLPESEIRR
jgi:hypothetical protein